MLKIGVTGGIGSGKTMVCQVFEVLGVPVFYADTAAKEIMYTDKKLKQEIQTFFGERSYTSDGDLDRKYLANIVFNDKQKLNKLNAIVHPAVFSAFDHWTLKQHHVPYVVKEAALLFESGSHTMCDYSVLVKAPLDLRIHRIIQRDHISLEEVSLRMNRQFTDEQKEKMADYILINDEQKLLIPEIIGLHEHFSKLDKKLV